MALYLYEIKFKARGISAELKSHPWILQHKYYHQICYNGAGFLLEKRSLNFAQLARGRLGQTENVTAKLMFQNPFLKSFKHLFTRAFTLL